MARRAAHVPLVPRCDEVRRDGSRFRTGHVVSPAMEKSEGRKEWTKL